MKIEYLFYITETAKFTTISAAAQALYLQQTTLSTAIKAMEAEIGIEIFMRTKRGITLTDEGACFVELAGKILDLYNQMRRISTNLNMPPPLRLVANPIACNRYSISVSQCFRDLSSGSTLSIMEAPRNQILTLVANNEYDFGIAYPYLSDMHLFEKNALQNHLVVIPLLVDKTYVYVGSKSPFSKRQTVSLEELRDAHLALTERGLDEYVRTGIDRIITKHSVFGNTYLVRQMVEDSDMITFYTSHNIEPDWFNAGTSIKKITIVNDAPIPSRHCLLYKFDRKLLDLEKLLIQCIQQIIKP